MTSEPAARPGTFGLTLLALGVVYGDIGTSPIYTIGLFFGPGSAFGPNPFDVLGVLSLIFWSLTLVVTFKYVVLILPVDNRGEGGVLALLALALRGTQGRPRLRRWVGIVGLFGVALFFADSAVTPAISVLSAVEGLEVAAPRVAPYVVPLAAAILFALFAFQSRGTARVGLVFGPIILVWFAALALLGLRMIVAEPGVLAAVDPRHALAFLGRHGLASFFGLGFIFLAVTGAEAMYADLGHFGRTPVRLGWLGIAYPALVINYFGQGALILARPDLADHPYFLLAPGWALYPMIVLTTLATIIASQAVISGAFSIGRQAVRLGYLPRLRILHTSATVAGQIYVPRVNLAMLVIVLTLVFWFGSSSAIASAYGVAVAGTMVVTVVLAAVVYLRDRRLPAPVVYAVFGALLVVDLAFFGASLIKIASGAFLPLAIAVGLFIVMTTWVAGRRAVTRRQRESQLALDTFLERVTGDRPPRVAGTAVYLTAETDAVPHALLHNLKHNQVLHERVVLLSVETEDVPRVATSERITVTPLGKRFYRVVVRFGFFQRPDVPAALRLGAKHGLDIDPEATSFFIGRQKLVPSVRPSLTRWRERLFMALARNAENATDYFGLPPNRVVELGAQLEI